MSPVASCSVYLTDSPLPGVQEVLSALVPALIQLCQDSVAAVRLAAGSQLGLTIARMYEGLPSGIAPDADMTAPVAKVCSLAYCPAFQQRQVYALTFEGIAQALSPEIVMLYFWPAFAALATDSVSNVRLSVCRTLLRLVLKPLGGENTDLRPGNILSSRGHADDFISQASVRAIVLDFVEDSDQEVVRVANQIMVSIR